MRTDLDKDKPCICRGVVSWDKKLTIITLESL